MFHQICLSKVWLEIFIYSNLSVYYLVIKLTFDLYYANTMNLDNKMDLLHFTLNVENPDLSSK
jgi:hypothetical protein